MRAPDPITRLNEALEGRYRVERQLGEGGMATVFLAHDLRHERKVALKVLKPELAAVVGAERFLAEIKTTANLQHPHILPLFDSGEADSFLFYVMPYVVGESLRQRLDREHQLPVDEAVQIARNLAEALDYAHRQGVIHRDIKPANILLQDGKPVVSDFGIALALGAAGAGRLTETGLSLGTPHYMSPEQATGDLSVGAATDVYALGCVLYEMLVGDPPYVGSTPQAILGKIIAGELTSAAKQRPTVPPHVDAAIRKALEKVPADRFSSASAFAHALSDRGFRYGAGRAGGVERQFGPWKPIALVSAPLAAVLAAVLGTLALRGAEPVPTANVARFEWPFREGQGPVEPRFPWYTIYPDGSALIYSANNPSINELGELWVRRLDDVGAEPLSGTLGAVQPAVSDEGQLIAFQQGGDAKVRPMAGGPVRTLGPGVWPKWAPDGSVYYTDRAARSIMRASGRGGEPELVHAIPDDLEVQFVWDFLPGGTHALLISGPRGLEPPELGVLALETGEVTPLGLLGDIPRYAPSGHLVYYLAGDSTVMAAPFDADKLEVGAPVPVLGNVAGFHISRDGAILYSTYPSATAGRTRLVRVSPGEDREVLAELNGIAWFPRFSPDGGRLAYTLSASFNPNDDVPGDVWVIDVARRAQTRVTFVGNNRWYPVWSPDGDRLTYADGSANQNRILSSPADGTGAVDTIFALGDRKFPTSWAPDGRTLAFYQGPAGTTTNSRDIWVLDLEGPDPTPFIATAFAEMGAIFSPDGSWVAYVSDKSGQLDVYVRPFPGPGPEVTVSVGGGIEPAWGPGGDEIYYRREGELMVAPIQRTGATLTVGAARRVMTDEYLRQTQGGAGGMANYAVTPDGSGVVMIEEVGGDTVEPARLFLVLNWLEELKRLVPVD